MKMKGLWVQPRDGRAYYRTRKGGKTILVPLPDLPIDHPDFIAAWAEAARTHNPAEKPAEGTLQSTWHALRGSDLYASWTPVYRAKIARQFDAVCARAGHVAAKAIRDPHITKDVAEAPSPGDRLRAWRAWGAWCKERGLILDNPAVTVRLPKQVKAKGKIGHRRWTPDEIERFRARWPIGSAPRAMMEFLFWTGFRISDAVRAGPQMIDRGGVLVMVQRKTGEAAYVPWSCPLPAYASESDRQMMLQAIAPFGGHLCFLPTKGGKPRSDKAAVQMMLKACTAAEIDVSAHGLRKTRAAMIVEGGGTTSQSAAWTGHQSLKLAQHYQREFDRRSAVMGVGGENEPETQLETGGGKSGNASA